MSDSFLEKLKKGMNLKDAPDFDEKINKTNADYSSVKTEFSVAKKLDFSKNEQKNGQKNNKESKKTKTKKNKKNNKSLKKESSSKKYDDNNLNESDDSAKITVKKAHKTKEEKKEPLKEDKCEGAEGKLMLDLYETKKEIVIESAIAGIGPENLDILIEGGIVKINGCRNNPNKEKNIKYLHQECHWGPFSRKIVLPCEVNASQTEAIIKNGILIIKMPKIEYVKKIKIKEEE